MSRTEANTSAYRLFTCQSCLQLKLNRQQKTYTLTSPYFPLQSSPCFSTSLTIIRLYFILFTLALRASLFEANTPNFSPLSNIWPMFFFTFSLILSSSISIWAILSCPAVSVYISLSILVKDQPNLELSNPFSFIDNSSCSWNCKNYCR